MTDSPQAPASTVTWQEEHQTRTMAVADGLSATQRAKLEAALVKQREQDRLTATSDWREGVAAMAERRPPAFTGE